MPAVSILLPVRDNAVYLPEAIQSIATQTFEDWECLAIDDGSVDASGDILRSWAASDPRVRVLEGGGQGIVAGLNLALAGAKGEWIARMDGDDVAYPARLEKQLDFIQAHSDVVVCGTQALLVDPKRRPLCETRNFCQHETILKQLEKGHASCIVHPSLMARRSALRSISGYREKYRDVEDFDLYLRLTAVGKLANLDEVLLEYRQHPMSANVLRRKRQLSLRQEALNEYRERNFQSPYLDLTSARAQLDTLSDLYADWSLKAAIGGNQSVALRYAILANLREFWRPIRWKLFWQIKALRKHLK